MKKHFILIIIAFVLVLSIAFLIQKNSQVRETKNETSLCKGNAACIQGVITHIVDGDTLDVNDIRIRLALVNAPELTTPQGRVAKQFVESICPVGSSTIVDQDDLQKVDVFGRIIGEVECNNKNLNKALLESNNSVIETKFCQESEFRNADWTLKFGC